jgi:HK97 family phage prohead protease
MATIDFSTWDANKAWAAGASSDDPAAFYDGICAGKKAGDPKTQAAHALPYRYSPSSPPNAAGVKAALSRLSQTDGLTNKADAQTKLDGLLTKVQAAEKNRMSTLDEMRNFRLEHYRDVPGGEMRRRGFPSELRGKYTKQDGRSVYEVEGYATIYNRGYEMWDMAGPYMEVVDQHSLDRSLAQTPDVAFLVNHLGVAMARSRSRNGNPTLVLRSDTTGMHIQSWLNAERQDVKDLASAIDDGIVDEMSFAFRIEDHVWDDDYTQLTLKQLNINRGDVSAVNFGANPFTSIAARAADWLEDLEHMPEVVVREAFNRLHRRGDSVTLVPEIRDAAETVIRRNAELYANVAQAHSDAQRVLDDAEEELASAPEPTHTRSAAAAMRELKSINKDYRRQLDQLDRSAEID